MDPKTIVILIVVSAAGNCSLSNIDNINSSHTEIEDMEYCQTLADTLNTVPAQSAFCIEVK